MHLATLLIPQAASLRELYLREAAAELGTPDLLTLGPLTASALRSNRRADQAIGEIERGADQYDG